MKERLGVSTTLIIIFTCGYSNKNIIILSQNMHIHNGIEFKT